MSIYKVFAKSIIGSAVISTSIVSEKNQSSGGNGIDVNVNKINNKMSTFVYKRVDHKRLLHLVIEFYWEFSLDRAVTCYARVGNGF